MVANQNMFTKNIQSKSMILPATAKHVYEHVNTFITPLVQSCLFRHRFLWPIFMTATIQQHLLHGLYLGLKWSNYCLATTVTDDIAYRINQRIELYLSERLVTCELLSQSAKNIQLTSASLALPLTQIMVFSSKMHWINVKFIQQ